MRSQDNINDKKYDMQIKIYYCRVRFNLLSSLKMLIFKLLKLEDEKNFLSHYFSLFLSVSIIAMMHVNNVHLYTNVKSKGPVYNYMCIRIGQSHVFC